MRIAPLFFAASLVACSAQNSKSPTGSTGPVGATGTTADLKGSISIGNPTALATSIDGIATLVCGTFTLQPYSLDVNGNQTFSGQPLVITSLPTAQTDTIAGCIDGPTDASGNNWGYLVTATNFVDCSGGPNNGQPVPNLSPTTVTENYPMDCQQSVDTPLAINVDVSISASNNAGYVDVTLTVDSTEVQIGCKEADIPSALSGGDGLLHFGESYIDANGNIHQGLVGLSGAPTPTQWDGALDAPSPAIDTYYTGTVDPTTTNLVLQTFLDACNAGDEYADGEHAQCLTRAHNEVGGPSTMAQLANVFMALGGSGYVSATLSSDGSSINVYTSAPTATTPNNPNIEDATNAPVGTDYNDGLVQNFVSAPANFVITGIYADQSTAGQLLVTATENGVTPGYFTFNAPWAALDATFNPLPDQATMACMGLFASPGGCFTPKSCAPTIPALSELACENATKRAEGLFDSDCGSSTISEDSLMTTPQICDEGYYLCFLDRGGSYLSYLDGYANANSNDCDGADPISSACTITNTNGDYGCSCEVFEAASQK